MCGEIHNSRAISSLENPFLIKTATLNSMLERAKTGVFHYMSKRHLQRYLDEIGFRWAHRTPMEKVTKNGEKKIVMVSLPVIKLLDSLLNKAIGRQLRRTRNGSILRPINNLAAAC